MSQLSVKDRWWATDIEFYLKWKALSEKYPNDAGIKVRLAQRRQEMVRLYGESAMKGI